jgi:hypothetical protein
VFRELAVGLISGINNLGRIVVFGVSIINGENKFNITETLRNFFTTMESLTDTLITDNAPAMSASIPSLNAVLYSPTPINHTLDHFHLLKSLNLNNELLNRLASAVLNAPTHTECKAKLEEIEDMGGIDEDKFGKLKAMA